MTVERFHWVGGFGRARWLEPSAVLAEADAALAIAEGEPSAIEQMNADHALQIDRYASRLLRRAGSGWRIVAIDPDGCDLAQGNTVARLPFPRPARNAGEVRTILLDLADAAPDALQLGRKNINSR